jgi:putative hydrolase of the HAD superfamily
MKDPYTRGSHMSSRKGLLVDYGGVLTTAVTDSFSSFARNEGIDPDALREVFRTLASQPESLFAAIETGRIGLVEFETRLATAIAVEVGSPLVADGLKARLFGTSQPDEMMIAAVRAARAAGVGTALVSNSWGGGDYPIDLLSELFESVVISGEVGVRKPDPEIFLHAAELIAVEAQDCAFVDDFEVNAKAASAVGMRGIWHQRTPDTIAELEAFLGVRLV